MTHRKHNAQGFTLVEILIVVVILGILAAIVVPQFTRASETAQGNAMIASLQTVRSQLELYRVQHNSNYPTLAQMWGNLTTTTDIAGATTGTNFGPYIQKAPSNPFTSTSTIAADNSYFDDLWDKVDERLREGSQLSEPLFNSPLIPRSIAQMIFSGEKSGQLGKVLARVADFTESEFDQAVKNTTQFIEPLMIGVMGAIIGFVAISLLLPIFSVGNVVAGTG